MKITKFELKQLIREELAAITEAREPFDEAGSLIRAAFGVDAQPDIAKQKAFEKLRAALAGVIDMANNTESRQEVLEIMIKLFDTIAPGFYEPSAEELRNFRNPERGSTDDDTPDFSDDPYTGKAGGHQLK